MNPHPDDGHPERDSADRHRHRDQYPTGTPHHSNAASLPIHQPVASRVSGAIHSPGGLLANHGTAPSSLPPAHSAGASAYGPDANRAQPHNAQNLSSQMFGALGGPAQHPGPPSGSSAPFGGPLQEGGNRPPQGHHFGAGAGPGGAAPAAPQVSQSAGNNAAVAQGQQPILNDALSYLDQVKVQFADQPDVYNKFLDIMKDFKSQTIDTPGVINRVSELFSGHPNLIQGFNTFLPPGYRIECGAGNDPNTIRVTTPMGTTVQSITGRATQPDGQHAPSGSGAPFFNQRPANWQQSQPQHSIESPEAAFSNPVAAGPSLFLGGLNNPAGPDPQQHNRGPPPNAQTTPNAPNARNALTPTPTGAVGGPNGSAGSQANMEKRGPVEFNHAISYVNKIKNRFQDKPEIYKQFLEILQTYQREQKPIQDVYAQVTSLFNTAPDLLEDFKQFLPESAASNKGNHQRAEEMLGGLGGLAQGTPQPSHMARDGQKMPPVGNFAPPASATKDNKKRPRNDKQLPPPTPSAPPMAAESPIPAARSIPGVSGSKRPKVNHKPLAADAPSIEPTLTPVMPEPLPPTSSSNATAEELGFFEKVKKFIGNRSTMNEFLKLCNMYSQSLIDTNDLVHKASMFIGGNPELMQWFKDFVGYQGSDEIIENRPRPPDEKVSLSNCRGSGPSYRLLPRREKLKPCGGRDEMCNAVLNDEWASHPTWASEDSGFVAHRKNAFEEGLHRIEEERHDYDFNIEANLKCIQLLEPIAQQMLNLSPQEREHFQMPPGLGGPSTSIYKRVLKKIYGPEKGAEVVNDMFIDPFAVVPVVLARLKQKDEEWRFTQREWEKVWQAQTEIMHLKSLDHMGIQVRQNDKRNLSAKHIVDVIKTKHEEQRRLRSANQKIPQYQFSYDFSDEDLILDMLRFLVLYVSNTGLHSSAEKERLNDFFESFIPQFFDLSEEKVQQKLNDIDRESAEEDSEEHLPTELTNGRSRRNGKKSDLLRGVLDPSRSGTKSRTQKEDSTNSGSKETTPDVNSANEEEMADAPDDPVPAQMSNERWLPTVPRATVVQGANPLVDADGELKADGFFPRPWYNFFCNQPIYVFITLFQTIYKRLKDVKDASPESVMVEIKRSKMKQVAKEIGLSINEINYFDEKDPASFWPKTVELIEEFINGEVDENRYQEVLRRYYLKKGWTLYTIQDLMRTMCRLALQCTSLDAKERTPDLISQFLQSRQREETSYQTEITARKFAERVLKEADIFVVCWFPGKKEATVRYLPRDETTFHMDEMELRERWQYYISSYMRVDPTEGVDRSRLRKSVLARNLPSSETDSDDGSTPKPVKYDESLILRICLNSNQIVWEKNTSEFFIYWSTEKALGEPAAEGGEASESVEKVKTEEHAAAVAENRSQRFREKMVMNNAWMRGISQDEVQAVNERFQKWVKDGEAPESNVRGAEAGGNAMEIE